MSKHLPRFLLIEPYYGGSHRVFLHGLCEHLDVSFKLITLPARKWKMRMQLAAPWFAEGIIEALEQGEVFDGIFCSSFLDVAVLRSLLSQAGHHLPLAVYFHENQFAYPVQGGPNDAFQFTAINFNTALCADQVAFNSRYNMDTFLDGVHGYLKKASDVDVVHLVDVIRDKSVVLYPGMDYSFLDTDPRCKNDDLADKVPVIVWNHRWEHDKGPEVFFKSLEELDREGVDFQVMVLGERFQRVSKVFSEAEKTLGHRIIHFGYAETKQEYGALLDKADIVVSTARHEFFGIAVLEAVRAGCRPLVPDRLSYRELFPKDFRYKPGGLTSGLRSLLHQPEPFTVELSNQLTQCFSWPVVASQYQNWLLKLSGDRV
ncbi:MAG: DUF3524 domain-containing protein [Desulfobulbaceae bacterium]|nr:DUF3524 domain-containing protein [Desulfobulbaceae bacterium]